MRSTPFSYEPSRRMMLQRLQHHSSCHGLNLCFNSRDVFNDDERNSLNMLANLSWRYAKKWNLWKGKRWEETYIEQTYNCLFGWPTSSAAFLLTTYVTVNIIPTGPR